ncbi:MAG: hypothetical protein Q6M04_11245 [Thermostichus sp. BF3_bins_97]
MMMNVIRLSLQLGLGSMLGLKSPLLRKAKPLNKYEYEVCGPNEYWIPVLDREGILEGGQEGAVRRSEADGIDEKHCYLLECKYTCDDGLYVTGRLPELNRKVLEQIKKYTIIIEDKGNPARGLRKRARIASGH